MWCMITSIQPSVAVQSCNQRAASVRRTTPFQPRAACFCQHQKSLRRRRGGSCKRPWAPRRRARKARPAQFKCCSHNFRATWHPGKWNQQLKNASPYLAGIVAQTASDKLHITTYGNIGAAKHRERANDRNKIIFRCKKSQTGKPGAM